MIRNIFQWVRSRIQSITLLIIGIFIIFHTLIYLRGTRGFFVFTDSYVQYNYVEDIAERMTNPYIVLPLIKTFQWPPLAIYFRAIFMNFIGFYDVRLVQIVDIIPLLLISIFSYLLFYRSIGKWALILSIYSSCVFLYAAREPFLDVYFVAVLMIAIYLMARYTEKPTFLRAMGAGFFIGASLLTKQAGALLLIFPSCILCFWMLFLHPERKSSRIKFILQLLLLSLVCLLVFLPWYVYSYPKWSTPAVKQDLSTSARFIRCFLPFYELDPLFSLQFIKKYFLGSFGRIFRLFPLLLFFSSFFGIVYFYLKTRKTSCPIYIVFTVMGTLYIMWFSYGGFCTRYFFPFLPFYAFFSIVWILDLHRKIIRHILLAFVMLILSYPPLFVLTDMAGIALPETIGIRVKKSLISGINFDSMFQEHGLTAFSGPSYTEYTFTSNYPYEWIWDASDTMKSLSFCDKIKVICIVDVKEWSPFSYILFRKRAPHLDTTIYYPPMKEVSEFDINQCDFLIINQTFSSRIPKSFHVINTYSNEKYTLLSRRDYHDILAQHIARANFNVELQYLRRKWDPIKYLFPSIVDELSKKELQQDHDDKLFLIYLDGIDDLFDLYSMKEKYDFLKTKNPRIYAKIEQKYDSLIRSTKPNNIGEAVDLLYFKIFKSNELETYSNYTCYFLFQTKDRFDPYWKSRNWHIGFYGIPNKIDVDNLPQEEREYNMNNWQFLPEPLTKKWERNNIFWVKSHIRGMQKIPVSYHSWISFWAQEKEKFIGYGRKKVEIGNIDFSKIKFQKIYYKD